MLASHLKPLEKGDRISDMGLHNQLWNINALNKHTGETEAPKVQLYKVSTAVYMIRSVSITVSEQNI